MISTRLIPPPFSLSINGSKTINIQPYYISKSHPKACILPSPYARRIWCHNRPWNLRRTIINRSLLMNKYTSFSYSVRLVFFTTKWISWTLQGPLKVIGYTKNVISWGTNTLGIPVSALHAAFHASKNAYITKRADSKALFITFSVTVTLLTDITKGTLRYLRIINVEIADSTIIQNIEDVPNIFIKWCTKISRTKQAKN